MISQRYGTLADRAIAAYGLDGGSDPKPDPENGTVMTQWTTDNMFRCGSIQELSWHVTAKNPGYEYQFSRTVHGQEAQGAAHASEIPFIFGTLSVWQQMRHYDESDQKYAPLMQQYWINFAKTGDPNGGSLVAAVRSGPPRLSRFHRCRPGGQGRTAAASLRFVHGKPEARDDALAALCVAHTGLATRLALRNVSRLGICRAGSRPRPPANGIRQRS
jgi:hypothetical protein